MNVTSNNNYTNLNQLDFSSTKEGNTYPSAVWKVKCKDLQLEKERDDMSLAGVKTTPIHSCNWGNCTHIPRASPQLAAGKLCKLKANKKITHITYVGLGSGGMQHDLIFIEMILNNLEPIKNKKTKLSVTLIDLVYQKNNTFLDQDKKKRFSYFKDLFPTMLEELSSVAAQSKKISSVELIIYNSIDKFTQDIEKKPALSPNFLTNFDTSIPTSYIKKIEEMMERPGFVVQYEHQMPLEGGDSKFITNNRYLRHEILD